MSHVRADPSHPTRVPRAARVIFVLHHVWLSPCVSHRPPVLLPPQIFDGYEKELLEFTASIARNTASLASLDGGTRVPAARVSRARTHAPRSRRVPTNL